MGLTMGIIDDIHVLFFFLFLGEKFHYTTHGYTLLSAVVEKCAGESFEKHMKRTFRDLGLRNTFLDENEHIIYHRARWVQLKALT